MTEYLDILDEEGMSINKKKTREEVHRKGYWHRTAHVWIINDKGEVLVQKRAAKKDSSPNKWDLSTGGHIASKKDAKSTAIAEAKEELSLTLKKKELVFLFTFKHFSQPKIRFKNNEFQDVFLVKKNLDLKRLKLQAEEVADVQFINYKKLKKILDKKDKRFTNMKGEYDKLYNYIER
jgi:isopentenyl-diphosphate Delta-isomerase